MSQYDRYKAYSNASQTVAKTRQVVMLYDGAIRFLNQAKESIEKGDIEQRFIKLTRVTDIISGLQSCLDYEAGQETAKTLSGFYISMEMRVFSQHHTPDAEKCTQIIKELKEMRDVWDAIDRGKDGVPETVTAGASTAPKGPVTIDSIAVSA